LVITPYSIENDIVTFIKRMNIMFIQQQPKNWLGVTLNCAIINVDFREITLDLDKSQSCVWIIYKWCVCVHIARHTIHISIMRGQFLNLDMGLKCYICVCESEIFIPSWSVLIQPAVGRVSIRYRSLVLFIYLTPLFLLEVMSIK
jgi:hypothetical protein